MSTNLQDTHESKVERVDRSVGNKDERHDSLKNNKSYVFGLDVVRAAAVSLVVISHMQLGFLLPGVPGVELFFVLSGYLVGGIFVKTIGDEKVVRPSFVLRFWQRRWARTLPNYFLFLIVFMIVFPDTVENSGQIAKYTIFIQNLNSPISGFFGLSWSLSVEEWFYLLLPVLTVIFLQATRRPVKAVALAAVFLIAGSFLARHFSHAQDANVGMRMVVIYRLDALAVGVLCAIVADRRPQIWLFFGKCWIIGGVGLFALSAVLMSNIATLTGLNRAALFTLMPLASALLIARAVRITDGDDLIRRAVKHISRWSYTIYLAHYPILMLLFRLPGYDSFPKLARLGVRGIAVIATLCVAAAIYRYFEQPALKALSPRKAVLTPPET